MTTVLVFMATYGACCLLNSLVHFLFFLVMRQRAKSSKPDFADDMTEWSEYLDQQHVVEQNRLYLEHCVDLPAKSPND